MSQVIKPKATRSIVFFSIILLTLFSCKEQSRNFRSRIDLSGYWQFETDTANLGIEKNWFQKTLSDSIKLPGTTDLNQKGFKNADTTTAHLNRLFIYEGAAWYKKEITIPENWKNRYIQLVMERTKPSKVWIDDTCIGESFLLESPQIHDLSQALSPGKHTITVMVNNSLSLTPYGNVHIYSDDTQTNWNGIIGDIYLEAASKTHITNVRIYPDIENKKINVQIAIANSKGIKDIEVELHISVQYNGQTTVLNPAKYTMTRDSVIEVEYNLGEETKLWDEYHQPLYTLNAIIGDGQFSDNKEAVFGMRKFTARGTRFSINGRTIFLRGKQDACVFPLTGHPPMDTEGWLRIFKIAKSYGINHYRFHSWCPPEAAFDAADQTGIYLQAETPFWGGMDSDTVADMIKNEGIALLESYANHPSFVMFSPGNEIWSGHERVKNLIVTLKNFDDRILYAQGSNNNIGYAAPMECVDFHVAARTPYAHDTILTHTRLIHAFADSKDGGTLNTQQPSTMVNFNYAVSRINMPLIGHEIGQFQIYPDYREIEKYTGVLRAWNLEVFRKRLEKAGMLDQDKDFAKVSGAWSALCYKAEIEAALRTEGFAGFQLLDLQDFPGQGTALVGILDAFMDSKGVVSREKWIQSCNDVVPLLLFEKYCWTNNETFQAKLKTANYSENEINSNFNWEIIDESGKTIKTDKTTPAKIHAGGLTEVGKIEIPLGFQTKAGKLTINVTIENTAYSNSYNIWIYPQPVSIDTHDDIIVASELDVALTGKLKKGGKVLLFPKEEDIKDKSVAGLFPPEFWNYGMFKGISEWVKKPVSPGTLSLLTDPEHPLFNDFPTDAHTNWQWFSIIKASNPLFLDSTDNNYRPIVQIIDNLERNKKLGLIFELKVGEGKLLVCMANLDKIQDKPEANQLYVSILNYMKSGDFNPAYTIDEALLNELLKP